MKQVTNSAFARLLEYEKRSRDFAPDEQVRGAADTIRDQIQETSRRIKRLGESLKRIESVSRDL